jgi:hypothetical protein
VITAWSPFGASRFRLSAGSRRLMLVAMLLFGLVYTHGVDAEGVADHLTPASTTASANVDTHGSGVTPGVALHNAHAEAEDSTTDTEHHGDEHGLSHPTHECLPGQPQQSPDMEAPCAFFWPGEAPFSDQWLDATALSEGSSAPQGLRDSTGAGVLRT